MKRCPKCNAQYDDTINFCLKDGTKLEYHGSATANSHENWANTKKQVQPKKRGCLRTIVITLIIIAIGIIAIYNFLVNAATYLNVEPNQLVIAKGGGEATIDIDYDGYIWTINHAPDWVEIDEYEKRFNLKITPNLTGQVREGSITVQSGKLIAKLNIQQKAFTTYIKPSTGSIHFDKNGGTEYVTITTDGYDYTVKYPKDYISVDFDDNEISIKASKNSGKYRRGTITITEDYAKTNIYITQGGKCEHCNGSGEIPCSLCYTQGGWGYGIYYTPCMMCKGNGKYPCSMCGGSGEKE